MAPCLSRSVHQIIRGLHALNFDGLMLQSDMYFLVGFVTVLFGAPARQVRCARFAAFRGRGAVSQPVLLPHGHPGDEFRHGTTVLQSLQLLPVAAVACVIGVVFSPADLLGFAMIIIMMPLVA